MPDLFKIKNETTFSTKITETIKVRTQCHYVMAAGTFNFLIYWQTIFGLASMNRLILFL